MNNKSEEKISINQKRIDTLKKYGIESLYGHTIDSDFLDSIDVLKKQTKCIVGSDFEIDFQKFCETIEQRREVGFTKMRLASTEEMNGVIFEMSDMEKLYFIDDIICYDELKDINLGIMSEDDKQLMFDIVNSEGHSNQETRSPDDIMNFLYYSKMFGIDNKTIQSCLEQRIHPIYLRQIKVDERRERNKKLLTSDESVSMVHRKVSK
jgi:hypothetical protein